MAPRYPHSHRRPPHPSNRVGAAPADQLHEKRQRSGARSRAPSAHRIQLPPDHQLMPNIASVLKSEISRVARREVRLEMQGLKKAVSSYRAEIAALKRRAQSLEQALRQLSKISRAAKPIAAAAIQSPPSRFSAKGLASQRKRLGLGKRLRSPAGRVRTVDLQMGGWHIAPSREASAGPGRTSVLGQEGSRCPPGCPARRAIVRLRNYAFREYQTALSRRQRRAGGSSLSR